MLAVDVSSSVDDDEYYLQMHGLAQAFRHPDVLAALRASASGGVAVALVQWSDSSKHAVAVDWMAVHDDASAAAFANAAVGAPRLIVGGQTSISGAIRFALRELETNAYEGARRTIDISGDGRANAGAPPERARRAAAAAGVTINGLAIRNEEPFVDTYFRNSVIAGEAAFLVVGLRRFRRGDDRETHPRDRPSPGRRAAAGPLRRRFAEVTGAAIVFTRSLAALAASAAAFAAVAAPARAAMDDPLAERLAPPVVARAFPEAEAVGAVEGAPPVAEALRGGAVAGYLFSTWDLAAPAGYSGEPFDIVGGVDLEGRLTGIVLLEHYEPMIGPELIPEEAMQRYLDNLAGARVDRRVRKAGGRGVDGVSGATISSTLMTGAVLLAGRKAARRAGLLGDGGEGLRLDLDRHEDRAWSGLVESGAVARLTVTRGEVARAFGSAAGEADGRPFLELHAALATPADIGRNLYSARWHNHHLSLLLPGDHLLTLAARGPWPVLRRARGGAWGATPLHIRQNGRAIPLDPSGFLDRTAIRASGAPRFADHALYRIAAGAGFDSLRPWTLEAAVHPSDFGIDASPGGEPARFALRYEVPRHLITGGEAALIAAGLIEPPTVLLGLLREDSLSDWQRLWVDRAGDIAILVGLLTALTLIFALQDRLARHRRLHRALRTGFLAVTLVWLGWMHDAQLTTLNVLTYARAALGGVDWRVFLVDPLILILSAYVGLSLVLWGRGVFCGWLCPFGALQELTNRAGRLLRVPQLRIPETVQEKLWALKYVAAAALCATAPRIRWTPPARRRR